MRGQGSVCGLLQLGDDCTSVVVGRGLCNAKVASVRQGFRDALAGWLADVWDEPDALSWSRQRLQRTELGLVAVKAAGVVRARERHESLGLYSGPGAEGAMTSPARRLIRS